MLKKILAVIAITALLAHSGPVSDVLAATVTHPIINGETAVTGTIVLWDETIPLWDSHEHRNPNPRVRPTNGAAQQFLEDFNRRHWRNNRNPFPYNFEIPQWTERDERLSQEFSQGLFEAMSQDPLLQAMPFNEEFLHMILTNYRHYFAVMPRDSTSEYQGFLSSGIRTNFTSMHNPRLHGSYAEWAHSNFARIALHEVAHSLGLGESLAHLFDEKFMDADTGRVTWYRNSDFDRVLLDIVGPVDFWRAAYSSNQEYGELWDTHMSHIARFDDMQMARAAATEILRDDNLAAAFRREANLSETTMVDMLFVRGHWDDRGHWDSQGRYVMQGEWVNQGQWVPQNQVVTQGHWDTQGRWETQGHTDIQGRWETEGRLATEGRWENQGHWDTQGRWETQGHWDTQGRWETQGRYESVWDNDIWTDVWVEEQVWIEEEIWVEEEVWIEEEIWVEGQVWIEEEIWVEEQVWVEEEIWVDNPVWVEEPIWVDSPVWSDEQIWVETPIWVENVVWVEEPVWVANWVWVEEEVLEDTSVDTLFHIFMTLPQNLPDGTQDQNNVLYRNPQQFISHLAEFGRQRNFAPEPAVLDGVFFSHLQFNDWDFPSQRQHQPIPAPIAVPTEETVMHDTSSQTIIRLVIGQREYSVNGLAAASDAAPFTADGRTMVPLRVIAEAMGANVTWIDATQTVIIQREAVTLNIPTNQPLPRGMGMPRIVNGRTFVPIAYVAEMLGATVSWDETTQSVTIVDS